MHRKLTRLTLPTSRSASAEVSAVGIGDDSCLSPQQNRPGRLVPWASSVTGRSCISTDLATPRVQHRDARTARSTRQPFAQAHLPGRRIAFRSQLIPSHRTALCRGLLLRSNSASPSEELIFSGISSCLTWQSGASSRDSGTSAHLSLSEGTDSDTSVGHSDFAGSRASSFTNRDPSAMAPLGPEGL